MEILPVVIVTCMRDIARLDTLLKSLEKFLTEDTDIHIINGDLQFNLFDTTVLKCVIPINSRHRYTLHNSEEITPYPTSSIGWEHQQVLKLCAYKLFSTDYLTMDSSNVVVRPWSFSDLKIDNKYITSGGQPGLIDDHPFITAINYYIEFFQIDPICIESCTTPFVMEQNIIKPLIEYFGSEMGFIRWFVDKPFDPSEYSLHSIFSQKLKQFDRN